MAKTQGSMDMGIPKHELSVASCIPLQLVRTVQYGASWRWLLNLQKRKTENLWDMMGNIMGYLLCGVKYHPKLGFHQEIRRLVSPRSHCDSTMARPPVMMDMIGSKKRSLQK